MIEADENDAHKPEDDEDMGEDIAEEEPEELTEEERKQRAEDEAKTTAMGQHAR